MLKKIEIPRSSYERYFKEADDTEEETESASEADTEATTETETAAK